LDEGIPEVFDLTGKVAVVTGASSGIGQALARGLASAGADIATLYFTEDDIARTRESIESMGRRVYTRQGDVSVRASVEEFGAAVTAQLGSPDIWVNNAGRLMVKPFLDTTDEHWRAQLGSNLDGYFYGCQVAARGMVERGRGRIINVSSVALVQPFTNGSAYVTSKGGVYGLTRALAVEFGPLGITVNAIAPGAVHSRLNTDVYTPDVIGQYEARIPVGRIGVPADLVSTAVFLAADESSYVTGVQIPVDGGMVVSGDVGLGDKG
jgi:NAD(P)-dependent dehydrogenase (short-subunit alcohol dehydrogenase family)